MLYLGKYRAQIIDTDDPSGQGRVKLAIPSVFGAKLVWADRVHASASKAMPSAGDVVVAEFLEGDTQFPLWTGWIKV